MALADYKDKIQQIGLALSYFGDAANAMQGRQSNFGGQSLASLRALQQQLLLNQELEKKLRQDSASQRLADSAGQEPRAAGMISGAEGIPGMAADPTLGLDATPALPGIASRQAPGHAALPATDFNSMRGGVYTTPESYMSAVKDFGNQQMADMKIVAPEAFVQAAAKNMFRDPKDNLIAVGNNLFNVSDPKNPVLVGTGQEKDTDKIKNIEALYGKDWRNNPEAVKVFNQSILPMSVSLSANTQGETAFEKSQNEAWGKEAAELGPAANQARERVMSVQQFLALSDQVKTGKLTPTLQEVAAWAQSLGIDPTSLNIDPKTADFGQVMDKISNRLAMQNIGPGGLPANNFSEADRKFVQATTVNKANTPEANRIIAQIGIAADRRTIEKEQSWLQARQKGVNFPTWKQQWAKYVDSTPMFPRVESLEQMNQLPSGTVFTAPDGTIRVKP